MRMFHFRKVFEESTEHWIEHPVRQEPDPDRTFWIIYMHFTQKERSDYYQLCS